MQLPWLVCSIISGALFAWAASRFAFEARRNGELELLLTTPAGAQTFVSDQWTALVRLLGAPVAFMLLPFLWHSLAFIMVQPGFGFLSLLGAANIILGIGALCWAGMWFGFIARRQSGAILLTLGLVNGVPFLISTLGMFFFGVFSSVRSWGIFPLPVVMIQVLIAWFYLRVIREAKHRLARELSHTGPTTFSLMRFTHVVVGAPKSHPLDAAP